MKLWSVFSNRGHGGILNIFKSGVAKFFQNIQQPPQNSWRQTNNIQQIHY